MEDAIKNFARQFAYQPTVLYGRLKKRYGRFIVAGMGGSHLAADLLKAYDPAFPVRIHSDYGLPSIDSGEKKTTLFIASSYSGNTEETIDALHTAQKTGFDCAAMSVGGKLGALAKKSQLPFVELPDTGIQPRSALGFGMKGLLRLMGESKLFEEVAALSRTLRPTSSRARGTALAAKLCGKVPVIYASERNRAVAYNWKIKFNETGKVPAFFNLVPELNHNEMTGFDHVPKNSRLAKAFSFLLVTDDQDDPRVQKRMAVLAKLYRERGLSCVSLPLVGANRWQRIFSSLVFADWVALVTARQYGAEPEQVPMVEEFKKLIA